MADPGGRAMAIGDFAQAHGFCAIAVGRGARAHGDFAVAIGPEALAEGDYQVAIRFDRLDEFRDELRRIRKIVKDVVPDEARQSAIFAVMRLAELLAMQAHFQKKELDGNSPSGYTLIVPLE